MLAMISSADFVQAKGSGSFFDSWILILAAIHGLGRLAQVLHCLLVRTPRRVIGVILPALALAGRADYPRGEAPSGTDYAQEQCPPSSPVKEAL